MKRIAALMLAGALVLSLGACGATKTEQKNDSSQPTAAEENLASTEGNGTSDESESAGQETSDAETEEGRSAEVVCPLEDGTYLAEFDTDSSMFRVNETMDGKGTLTVKDGKMTIHVTLLSKKILQLYYGLAEDAKKEGASVIEPVIDVVTYDDGLSEEVYGFDVPVPYLNEEFDVALVGTKGTWYDHKVSVSNPVKMDGGSSIGLPDGEYQARVTLAGGSGKATVESPAKILSKDGKCHVVLVWSSKNYDYMIVDGEKYLNEAAEGENSVFTIPVPAFGEEFTVIGDTVAMSTPHEIEYTLFIDLQQ